MKLIHYKKTGNNEKTTLNFTKEEYIWQKNIGLYNLSLQELNECLINAVKFRDYDRVPWIRNAIRYKENQQAKA